MDYQPCNILAEQSLIGAILLDGGSDYAMENVKADDFYDKKSREYFEAILLAHSRNDVIEYATIADLVPSRNFVDLGELIKNTHSSANLKGYAKAVISKSVERKALAAFYEASELIKGEGTTQEKIAAATLLTSDIAIVNDDSKPVHIKQIARDWLDDYDARIADDAPIGLKTGIDGLDDIYGYRGIGETDLIVIAARPKMAKTQTLVKITSYMVKTTPKAALIFSMEMPNIQLFERYLTNGSRIQGDKFYRAMDDYEFAKIGEEISQLSGTKLYIDDRSNLSLAQVKATVKKFKEEHGDIVVGLDYFTLMKTEESGRTDLAFGKNSTGLKTICKELKTPMLLLAQLSRGVDSRPNKRPLLSDIRESGSIEQDADSIIFLYKDSVYNPDNGLGGLTENIVAANRHGETGTAYTEMKGGWLENINEVDVNHMMSFSGASKDDWHD